MPEEKSLPSGQKDYAKTENLSETAESKASLKPDSIWHVLRSQPAPDCWVNFSDLLSVFSQPGSQNLSIEQARCYTGKLQLSGMV